MNKLLPFIMILALGGCAVLPENQPVAVHDFGVFSPNEGHGRQAQAAISVEAPEWLADTHIRYRLLYAAPTQVRFYSLDRWIAPPNELFEQVLKANNLVLNNGLTIYLEAFEQQFDAPGHAKTILRFNVVQAKISGGKYRQQAFTLQQPCPSADAQGAVNAFSAMARRAAGEIQAWLMEDNGLTPH